MAKLHSVSFYRDGFIKVEFCQNCGAEGGFLVEECKFQMKLDEESQLSLFEKAVDKEAVEP